MQATSINESLISFLTRPGTEFRKKYGDEAARYGCTPKETDTFFQNVELFFRTRLDEKRAVLALELQRYVLKNNDMEDYSPILAHLTAKEFQGKFFKHYRDHTAHQVMVFFLGAYLYETLPGFRAAYERQHAHEYGEDKTPLQTGFYFQWSSTALFHDFGYFFDVDDSALRTESADESHFAQVQSKKKLIAAFFKYLEGYFNEYLVLIYTMAKGTPSVEKAAAIRRLATFQWKAVTLPFEDHLHTLPLTDLRFARGFLRAEMDAFDLLEAFAAKHYKKFSGFLPQYFEILNTAGAPYAKPRPRVWDHGIASALLFLKLTCFGFKVYDDLAGLTTVADKLDDEVAEVSREFKSFAEGIDYRPEVFGKLLVSSALAIAVHNLRSVDRKKGYVASEYAPAQAKVFAHVRQEVLPVKLDDHFLSYLLLMVDQLQDWDRYHINKQPGDNALNILDGHSIAIAEVGDRIRFTFQGNAWVNNRMQEIINDLDELVADWRTFIEIEFRNLSPP